MHDASYRALPIFALGGEVKAEVLVDSAAYEWASLHRWHLDRYGYVRRVVRAGRWVRYIAGYEYLHRRVLGLEPGIRGDHINGDKLDNRRANLRVVTSAQNAQNQGPRQRHLKASGYRGVVWDKTRRKWRAQVVLDGKCHNLGRFDSEHEAHAVVSAWRAEHMPFSEDARAAA